MELFISLLGAFVAIGVAILGAIFTNRNNIRLQKRKLKEEHYIAYVSALHNLATTNKNEDFKNVYTHSRDELMLFANVDVINKLLEYERAFQNGSFQEEAYTNLIKAIRKDLNLKNKDLPQLGLIK